MVRRTAFLALFTLLGLGILSYRVTYALFSSNASSTNNIFAAASIFPSPSFSPSASASPTGSPSGSPSPTPIACSGQIFANGAVVNTVGVKKDDSAITDPNRTDPNKATGANDWVVGTGTNFYSLGKNGVMTLTFASPLIDVPGSDLTFYEATNGRETYPEEKVDVSVSSDGVNFINIGSVNSEPGPGTDGITTLDLSGNSNITHIKLTESTNFTPHTNDSDGFDLDAVKGFCSQP